MTIRKKIFILAGILLALFGLVVGALAFVQKLNNDQISNIVAYELPLTRLVSEFDVDTDKYELVILRERREDSSNSQSLKTATSTVQAIADELRADVAAANSLMDKEFRTRTTRSRTASIWRASAALSDISIGILTTSSLSASSR
jgi:adenylate cyclase